MLLSSLIQAFDVLIKYLYPRCLDQQEVAIDFDIFETEEMFDSKSAIKLLQMLHNCDMFSLLWVPVEGRLYVVWLG